MSSPYKIEIDGHKRTYFILDENKCVACQACVVACMIENNTSLETLWRKVLSYNETQNLDLPIFHLSMACNHCEEAACMSNCPALAYERDLLTGAILHNSDHCIGCQYCTWVCPYDAPKFNEETKVVEKCNFCVDRLHENLKPACVTSCPTGALEISQTNKPLSYPIDGHFNDFGISPSLKVIPLSENRQEPAIDTSDIEKLEIPKQPKSPQISFKKEYPLTIFSFLMAFLAGTWGGIIRFEGFMDKWFFAIPLLTAFVLSTQHLGKPLRAWRAILNIHGSWLSREIVLSSTFAALSLFYLFVYPHRVLGAYTQAIAFLMLYAIDKLYSHTVQKSKLPLHSAQVSLTGLLFFGLSAEFYVLLYLVLLLKFVLFVYRSIETGYWKDHNLKIWAALRIFFLLWGFMVQQSFIIPLIVWIFLIISEFTDRAMFYEDIEKIRNYE